MRVDAARQRLGQHHSAQRQPGNSVGTVSYMGKDESCSRQKKPGVWWLCACGDWAWADRKTCPNPRCRAPCPAWCQKYQVADKHGKDSRGNGPRSAAGNAPATIVVEEFVVPGHGKKAQRKARQLARALADAKAYRELQTQEAASKPADAEPVGAGLADADDAEMVPSCDPAAPAAAPSAELEHRLSEAQATVAKWEAIPLASRELVDCFEQRLAEAVAARDAVLREKRAAKPWVWRLKGAERTVARAERSKTRVATEIDELLAQRVDLEQRLADKRAELESARVTHEEAVASLALVRSEAASDDSLGIHTSSGPPDSAADILQGLVSQLDGIPRAVAAGNLDAALRAVQQQVQALLPTAVHEDAPDCRPPAGVLVTDSGVGNRPPGTAAAASAMAAEAEAMALGEPAAAIGHRTPGTEEVAAAMAVEARAARTTPY